MIAPAPRRREAAIQTEVLRLLHARGVAAWPVNRESGVRRALGNERITARIGGPGFADIVGIVPNAKCEVCGHQYICSGCLPSQWGVGRFLAIEVKAPKAGTQRRRALAQAAFGAVVTQAGGIYLRIDPKSEKSACVQVCEFFGWTVQ